MASKRISKRSSSRNERDVSAQSAVKRARSKSDSNATPSLDRLIEMEDGDNSDGSNEDPRIRIESRIDDGSDQFTIYARIVLAMPDYERETNDCQDALSLLMESNDLAGDFWQEAWPIEVYGDWFEHNVPFDTPWSGNTIVIDQLDRKAPTRRGWYNALRSFRNDRAEKKEVIDFAAHYAVAVRLASIGYPTTPQLRCCQSRTCRIS